MKKCAAIAATMLFLLSLCGCGKSAYRYTYTDVFDTVTTFVLYAENEKTADALAEKLHERLAFYHRLYSIYDTFDGVSNLRTVNERAGETVEVEREILDLLTFGKDAFVKTNGKVNIAMGSVLQLWHEARDAVKLPSASALAAAAVHCDIENLLIDEAAQTVRLADPAMRLDVGAVAKGFAGERLADYARELGIDSALFSLGGNVVAVGDKGGEPFVIGIEDPRDLQSYTKKVAARDLAVVTSGDYQRYFTLDGVRYHHLIDPATRYPAPFFQAVTVVGADSGVADMLSTALFLMPQDEGAALLATFDGYAAMWTDANGTQILSDKFEEILYNQR